MQKQKTRDVILKAAKRCFISRGFLDTTTSEIAGEAGIAHGTLFLHFPNKAQLIVTIFDMELDLITAQIVSLVEQSSGIQQLLARYLLLLREQEDLFAVIARELPFYPAEIRRRILFKESLLRQHFHRAIEQGTASGKFIALDVPMALTCLFGTINYLLSLKPIFVSEGSVIVKFQERLLSTFTSLIKAR